MRKIQDNAVKIARFLSTHVWQMEKNELPRIQALAVFLLRMVSLTARKFIRDNCALRASALTFYSLLSVVPIMALVFGLAKGFGLDQRLENQLYQRLAGQQEVLEKIITFSRSLLENTKGGLIAGIGVALLFWSAIKLLGHIETALNEIWEAKPRSFIRRFTDYLTIMIVSPLLVVVSSSLTVYITTQVTAITGRLALLKLASPLIFFMLKLLPFGLIWLLFIMIYVVMPNTQIRLISNIIAGVVAGTLFQVFQGIYISAQLLVAKYNAIYGSFAALPLFLIWLQLSWIIVLLGAQIGYAHQHAGHAGTVLGNDGVSSLAQKIYGLRIFKYLINCFQKGEPAPSAERISDVIHLPLPLVIKAMQKLKACALVSEVTNNRVGGPAFFQPARDIQSITVSEFLAAWDRQGSPPLTPVDDAEMAGIEAAMASIDHEIERSEANRLIKDI
jgi:membrane protein